MSWNTFGRILRFTTWGESHGPAIGAVVDGCPPRLALSEEDIQPFLDARKPGQNKEESLVSKLLAKSIRKEKSHILQCFRFLVKTKFKMAFT